MPRTQTYRLSAEGFRLCVLFLKLFKRVYGPLAAAALEPIALDVNLPDARRATLDHLYAGVDTAVDRLLDYLGLAA